MEKDITEKIRKTGIIPVVVIDSAKDALPLGRALTNGGLLAAEVTFRTDAAKEAIEILAKEYPEMLVGAGTVLTHEQADAAVAAGAKFLVTPGFNPEQVSYCLNKGYNIIPGVQTPGEMEQALDMGFKIVKFFPAEAAGGLNMLKAVAAPYTELTFMPTGGINENNVRDYLAYNRIIACGGSWMVKKDLIAEGKFEEIKDLTAKAAGIVKEIRGNV
ncbi:MAG: bifunctional 4-hydroxy-2-oxoglutarate aldolase/2-dehydro-3-deoxy-phosphogluconate aldolase [Lachnospiraceae bacterium]|nr:bifunctional 4-hydroxy-2-oxoglutarate aldolase/2-dehydro-3-deoxy-phosphogluconate aldolase [Lachnospiraceae bacterium]